MGLPMEALAEAAPTAVPVVLGVSVPHRLPRAGLRAAAALAAAIRVPTPQAELAQLVKSLSPTRPPLP